MLTLARLAALITELKCRCTFGGIETPSEKKRTALRPGRRLIELTIAIKPFVVAYPCWSRCKTSNVSSVRVRIVSNVCSTEAAPAADPAAAAPAPPLDAPEIADWIAASRCPALITEPVSSVFDSNVDDARAPDLSIAFFTRPMSLV